MDGSMNHEDQQSDIVWGAEAIGKVINQPLPSTFHLLSRGKLPAKRVGRRWVASRKKLIEFLVSGEVQ